MSVIQTSTDDVTAVQGFINPINVAAGRDGDKVYVVNNVIVGTGATEVAVNPVTHDVYVTNPVTNTVLVIEP